MRVSPASGMKPAHRVERNPMIYGQEACLTRLEAVHKVISSIQFMPRTPLTSDVIKTGDMAGNE